MRIPRSLGVTGLFLACSSLSLSSASAQTGFGAPGETAAPFKASWEVEPFGGGGFASGGGFRTLTSAQDQLSLPTNSGKEPSSWFLNSLGSFGPGKPFATPEVPLKSLLTVVGNPDIGQPTRGAFGVRVTRWGSPHVGLEFVAGGTAAPPNRLGGSDIEQSRASFESAFGTLFAASPQLYGAPTVTATTTTQTSAGGEFDATAAIVVTKASGRIRPYATAGGGYRLTAGADEAVNVTGRYTFATPTGAPIDQTDSVTIHYHTGSTGIMAFSGGARIMVNAHSGLRVDARMTTGKNRDSVSVDAMPTSVPGTPAGFVLQPGTKTNPPLVFSNTPDHQTTLSGPAVDNLATALGTGWRRTWTVTVGWFWAF
jgi:hypothetical protein